MLKMWPEERGILIVGFVEVKGGLMSCFVEDRDGNDNVRRAHARIVDDYRAGTIL